eukprot:4756640-Pleurochrysis_carterae.AAC.1
MHSKTPSRLYVRMQRERTRATRKTAWRKGERRRRGESERGDGVAKGREERAWRKRERRGRGERERGDGVAKGREER